MPRVVDGEQRRRAIAHAVFRVVCARGLDAVTLGGVAAEAGLATGSVRHFVGSRTDLLVLTLRTLRDDVRRRVRALDDHDPEAALQELLPLDDVRRTEAVVWLAFEAAARTEGTLRPLLLEVVDDVRGLHRRVVAELCPGADEESVAAAADRVAAVLDGLTVGAVLVPDRTDAGRMRRVLADELAAIAGRAGHARSGA